MVKTSQCRFEPAGLQNPVPNNMSRDAWKRYTKEGDWYYEVVSCGFKYNLSDIQSAIGIHQLRKLEQFIQVRTRYAHLYNERFAGWEEIELPPDTPHCRHAWPLVLLTFRL